ncbi:Catalase-related peroxidase [Paraconexibacter sp. AEG42_29]|uniref:Catalase-related peroxidase n=1 Tax=Paraconexibacter sp. AEG42_29 TaxID=2997339 RepID=A0AAU7AQZ2_9ACTN
MPTDPVQAVDVAKRRFGDHPQARALHAKGTWVRGVFTATPEARSLSRAAHLQGDKIDVLARFSNGSGDPQSADYKPDVRGLAVRFTLPGGGETDLLAQSVPRFFSPTPEHFVDFIRANTGRTSNVKLPLFLARHPAAARSLPVNARALAPVSSYVNCRYFTVHALRWTNAQGTAQHVRCDWRPEATEIRISEEEARHRGHDYLAQELRERLGTWPARFILDAQIADPDDPVDDPSQHWPDTRRRVDVGTLTFTEVIDDPEAGGDIVVFDPSRLTDGIASTRDPVLAFRPAAYSESARRRAGPAR